MQSRFFSVNATDPGPGADDLNSFLRTVRVVGVERQACRLAASRADRDTPALAYVLSAAPRAPARDGAVRAPDAAGRLTQSDKDPTQ